MKNENNGGPAFPSTNDLVIGNIETSGHAGMTLRDYFAAKAMQSMVSSDSWIVEGYRKEIARRAYVMADAMLEARK